MAKRLTDRQLVMGALLALMAAHQNTMPDGWQALAADLGERALDETEDEMGDE